MQEMSRISFLNSFEECLIIQDRLNSIIDQDWRNSNLNFVLAADLEAAEAIEHYGWKWWKKQVPDINQTRMEIVDIFHFLLSQVMVEDRIKLIEVYNIYTDTSLGNYNFIEEMHNFMKSRAPLSRFYYFLRAMKAIDMTSEELFRIYKSKAILNEFRQLNGYKEGTYLKNWGGVEDNEYLTSIYEQYDGDFNTLMSKLTERYKEVWDKTNHEMKILYFS